MSNDNLTLHIPELDFTCDIAQAHDVEPIDQAVTDILESLFLALSEAGLLEAPAFRYRDAVYTALEAFYNHYA